MNPEKDPEHGSRLRIDRVKRKGNSFIVPFEL